VAKDADQVFIVLADGRQVMMRLNKTFFPSRFGMVTDRFGVLWITYVTPWDPVSSVDVKRSNRKNGRPARREIEASFSPNWII
jgi:hypothetical protein